jgi:CheY-like chemotaxis protein
LLKLNLEQTDHYDVRVENCPEGAYDAAREFKPDLVLLDVMMPRIFGGEVAARIRADKELTNTVIVFLTASVKGQRIAEHEGMVTGFPMLAKPASVEEVINTIEKNLAK